LAPATATAVSPENELSVRASGYTENEAGVGTTLAMDAQGTPNVSSTVRGSPSKSFSVETVWEEDRAEALLCVRDEEVKTCSGFGITTPKHPDGDRAYVVTTSERKLPCRPSRSHPAPLMEESRPPGIAEPQHLSRLHDFAESPALDEDHLEFKQCPAADTTAVDDYGSPELDQDAEVKDEGVQDLDPTFGKLSDGGDRNETREVADLESSTEDVEDFSFSQAIDVDRHGTMHSIVLNVDVHLRRALDQARITFVEGMFHLAVNTREGKPSVGDVVRIVASHTAETAARSMLSETLQNHFGRSEGQVLANIVGAGYLLATDGHRALENEVLNRVSAEGLTCFAQTVIDDNIATISLRKTTSVARGRLALGQRIESSVTTSRNAEVAIGGGVRGGLHLEDTTTRYSRHGVLYTENFRGVGAHARAGVLSVSSALGSAVVRSDPVTELIDNELVTTISETRYRNQFQLRVGMGDRVAKLKLFSGTHKRKSYFRFYVRADGLPYEVRFLDQNREEILKYVPRDGSEGPSMYNNLIGEEYANAKTEHVEDLVAKEHMRVQWESKSGGKESVYARRQTETQNSGRTWEHNTFADGRTQDVKHVKYDAAWVGDDGVLRSRLESTEEMTAFTDKLERRVDSRGLYGVEHQRWGAGENRISSAYEGSIKTTTLSERMPDGSALHEHTWNEVAADGPLAKAIRTLERTTVVREQSDAAGQLVQARATQTTYGETVSYPKNKGLKVKTSNFGLSVSYSDESTETTRAFTEEATFSGSDTTGEPESCRTQNAAEATRTTLNRSKTGGYLLDVHKTKVLRETLDANDVSTKEVAETTIVVQVSPGLGRALSTVGGKLVAVAASAIVNARKDEEEDVKDHNLRVGETAAAIAKEALDVADSFVCGQMAGSISEMKYVAQIAEVSSLPHHTLSAAGTAIIALGALELIRTVVRGSPKGESRSQTLAAGVGSVLRSAGAGLAMCSESVVSTSCAAGAVCAVGAAVLTAASGRDGSIQSGVVTVARTAALGAGPAGLLCSNLVDVAVDAYRYCDESDDRVVTKEQLGLKACEALSTAGGAYMGGTAATSAAAVAGLSTAGSAVAACGACFLGGAGMMVGVLAGAWLAKFIFTGLRGDPATRFSAAQQMKRLCRKYELEGFPPSMQELEKKFREAARKVHPDKVRQETKRRTGMKPKPEDLEEANAAFLKLTQDFNLLRQLVNETEVDRSVVDEEWFRFLESVVKEFAEQTLQTVQTVVDYFQQHAEKEKSD